ncbi:dienelactone hydrolase family protein [Oceanobacter mangrovi]|uniref:dienelactone hydrolase family protein n=1 Tax=Oceanobacter mangrovi TaxID=2862510 RepID=UPI001C8D0BFB|nr:dienelactone hydrolase family protein [Oceanobacter mangrovi]
MLAPLLLLAAQVQASMVSEVHVFNTVTMSDQQLLRGKGGSEAGIVGALKLPAASNNPAVILLYGPGGYTYELQDWVELLNKRGIATFMVESTNGRVESYTGLRQLAMIRDAYAALAVLSEHPAIDKNRIALIGFTDAGQAALYSGMKRMKELYGDARYNFAAIASFYPNCSFQYREDEQMAGAPVRVFHGEKDNVNAIADCRNYVQRASAAGGKIRLSAYPGAEHAFDLKYPERVKDHSDESFRDCTIREAVKGVMMNETTGRMFHPDNDCVKHDGRWAYNADAAIAVKVELPAFLEQAFGQVQTAQRPAAASK